MWNGKTFAVGLLAGSAVAFGIEMLPVVRDPSLRFALDRSPAPSPGESVDDLVAILALFGSMGLTIEMLRQARVWAGARL